MLTAILQTSFYVAAVVSGLLVADSVAGVWYRTNTSAQLHITAGCARVDQLVVIFPGFAMPGEMVSMAFAPLLGSVEAMAVVQYAERGIDMDDICCQLVSEIDRLRPMRLRVYGASMGGMCAADFLDRYCRKTRRVNDVTLILDTSPSGIYDIRLPRTCIPAWYRGGPLSSLLWRLWCQFYRFAPSEPGVDRQVVTIAHRAFGSTGMPTLTSQAHYIRSFSMHHREKGGAFSGRTVYLRGNPSGGDPVIAIDLAIAGWRSALPNLQLAEFKERLDIWHVPIIERPRETLKMILTV
ncbi:MAG TPA: hypothetical protein VFC19_51740 [Candidatus Limnocylindrales bacterium]|nr:hypothetical protein [Candidatus Limnocylindrales bacterium]